MKLEPEALHQRLDALRATFAMQLPDRLAALSASCAAVVNGSISSEALDSLVREAHNLKGTAATYGFTAISAATARLEDLGDILLRRSPSQRRAYDATLSGLLADLVRTAEGPRRASELGQPWMSATTAEPRQKLVYLLIDDPSARTRTADSLLGYPYEVCSFQDVDLCGQAMRQTVPDALIIEVLSQKLDASVPQAMARLRQVMPNTVPLIVVTSGADLETRVTAVRAGAAALFTAPANPRDLAAALDRVTAVESVEPFRILLVDDDAAIANFHREILKFAGMDARVADAPEAVMAQLSEFRPDLLLLDMHMPRISGRELAAVIRQEARFANMPIVFLSDEGDRGRQLAALVEGADDFLTKPIAADHLVAAVSARAGRSRRLHGMTLQDPMTRLLNHSALKDRLAAELSRATRLKTPLTFALIDIDDFKSINDGYGHPVGDTVICGLADMLRQRLRQSDAIGRYGGEEFGIVMPETSLEQALAVLDDLRVHFGEREFEAGEARFRVTFTSGAALAGSADTPINLIAVADAALYAGKRRGRNQVVGETQGSISGKDHRVNDALGPMLLRPGTLDLADPDHDGAGASTDSSQVVETGTFGSAVSIFIVDDDRAIRDLLRALFEGAGYLVEDYRDCEAFLAAYDAGRRGCLLVDGYLPGMSGLDLLRHLGARKSGLPVIMITGHSDVPIAVQAMKAGASDFIAKPIRPNELLASVARALEQTRDVAPIPTGHEAALECLAALTSRQREVLDRILAGQPNKIIAADLGISQRTVERHRWSIMKRTGSNSLPALSRLAFVAAAGRVRSST